MEKVTHIAKVKKINGKNMIVTILQVSACQDCHAKSVCISADTKEKDIEIRNFNGNYTEGQTVTVVGSFGLGMKAVFLAYILPLILMLVVMFASYYVLIPKNEAVMAVLSLSTIILYYVCLIPFREQLKKVLEFTIE